MAIACMCWNGVSQLRWTESTDQSNERTAALACSRAYKDARMAIHPRPHILKVLNTSHAQVLLSTIKLCTGVNRDTECHHIRLVICIPKGAHNHAMPANGTW